jgi:hypothetical protein
MHFMLLILAFLLWAVVWGFFHANPKGVAPRWLLACNVVIVALAVGAATVVGLTLHADAVAQRPDERALAAYLGVMAGSTLFMIVLAVGGLLRNLLLFPLSRRKPA